MYSPKLNAKGFTIIEVMIVLVIAAVILLIVFLAVPALQRNSRNSTRRADVGRITTTFLEYINAPNPIPTGSTASNADLAAQIKTDARADSFDSISINSTAPAQTGSDTHWPRATIRTQSICNETNTNVDGQENSGRVALLYWIETSSDMQRQCVQLR